MTTSTDAMLKPGAVGGPILRAEGVTLRFGGLTSLDKVGLALYRGEILAVIGPNGAGKTSLFNSLTGVYLPQEGEIEFVPDAGPPVDLVRTSGLTRRRSSRKPHLVNRVGISRTFQNIRLFNALTVLENVQIAAETRSSSGPIGVMLGLPRNRRNERGARQHSREMLEFVGLRGNETNVAASLSYGDQRRLEIARALASDPKVLLLDEPAAGTNPSEKLGLAQLITRINTELGISILLIEHDMRLVMSVAHRITVLNFGKVIASGSPAEVQQNPAVIEAYLGSDAAEVAEAEAAAAEAAPGGAVADAVPADAVAAGAVEAEAEAGAAEPSAEAGAEAEAAEPSAEAEAGSEAGVEAAAETETAAEPSAEAGAESEAGAEADTAAKPVAETDAPVTEEAAEPQPASPEPETDQSPAAEEPATETGAADPSAAEAEAEQQVSEAEAEEQVAAAETESSDTPGTASSEATNEEGSA